MRIELRGVRRSFGRTEVLRGIDLDVPTGRRLALIGPNGSGKSTLIRATMGLVACAGSVRVDGVDPFVSRVEVAQRLAYVPQVAPQLAATVAELVRTAAVTRGICLDAIAAEADRLELSLAAVADRPFRGLSGGMKQKLLVALAFAARPQLLVMDEPTASLDAKARERFFRLFDGLPANTTLVLCSHRLEELRHLATHVVELAEGRVAYDGAIDALLAARGRSVVEVCIGSEAHAPWLHQRGFREGAPGWWRCTVSQEEKMKVVPELTAALGGGMRNLLVRDVESIDLAAGAPHA